MTVTKLVALLRTAGRQRGIAAEAAKLHVLLGSPKMRQPAAVEQAMGLQLQGVVAQLDAVSCCTLQTQEHRVDEMFTAHPDAKGRHQRSRAWRAAWRPGDAHTAMGDCHRSVGRPHRPDGAALDDDRGCSERSPPRTTSGVAGPRRHRRTLHCDVPRPPATTRVVQRRPGGWALRSGIRSLLRGARVRYQGALRQINGV